MTATLKKMTVADSPLSAQERYSIFPFYICMDISESMSGEPIAAVNKQLPMLRTSIGSDPAVAEVIRVGIITFSDTATSVLPLSDLSMVDAIPELVARGRTSYAAMFDHVFKVIESDYHASRSAGDRWYRPAVILISDGRPTDESERWRSALSRLTDPSWKRRPNILAFGFGDADPAVLSAVTSAKANRAFVAAEGADPATVIPELLAGLVQSIVSSSASVYDGQALLEAPQLTSMRAIPVDELD